MKLVVGLGNPGKEYDKTRHNIGFMMIDQYLGEVKYQEKFQAMYYETMINDEKVLFIKPTTFMNSSGDSIGKFAKYYNVNPEDILVIHDDLDMTFGKIKIKTNTSDGGHNGIKSIISQLNSESFYHLKIGILNDKKKDAISFVLKKFSKTELNTLIEVGNNVKDIIDLFIENKINNAMNKYN